MLQFLLEYCQKKALEMIGKVWIIVLFCSAVPCFGNEKAKRLPLLPALPQLPQFPSIFNKPLPPRAPSVADNNDQTSDIYSGIALANYSDPNLHEEADFVPGSVVQNNAFLNPLMRFRDSLVTKIIPALQRPFTRQAEPVAVTYYDDCTDRSGFYCNNCNTIMLCNQAADPLVSMECPTSARYCSQNGCSTTTTDDMCSPATTFKCTSEGYFPDPHNCSIFYYCPEASANPDLIKTYECPPNYSFNSRTRNCQRTLLMLPRCTIFDCTGKNNEFALYKPNNGYFGFCSKTGENAYNTIMFKCPDADNMVFNLDKLGCEYKCTREGFYEDTLDCKKYYFCYRQGLQLKYLHETCPDLYMFKDGKCVKTDTECVTVARK